MLWILMMTLLLLLGLQGAGGDPTPHPTPNPTPRPTADPSPQPTEIVYGNPSVLPTPHPTPLPSAHPTPGPSLCTPTYRPSSTPRDPTPFPTRQPTKDPSAAPTPSPQLTTPNPTTKPSRYPTPVPTSDTEQPSPVPTPDPTGTAAPTAYTQDTEYPTLIRYSRVQNCPNRCNGNGVCDKNCTCFPGYHGVDCSLRLCPSGRAWVDMPSADNVAHGNFTECSNMGTCNRITGECSCNKGFTGAACERNLCPIGTNPRDTLLPCSGNGICVPTRDRVQENLIAAGTSTLLYNEWDADMVHGCNCDNGWEGVACNLRTCPHGDDPITSGVSETQFVDCMNLNSVGSIILSFGGKSTKVIQFDATAELVKWHLEKLDGIEEVSVTITAGSTICSSEGSLTEIEFVFPQKPPFQLVATKYENFEGWVASRSSGEYSMVDLAKTSVSGTREYMVCSNRGTCDAATGRCTCFSGFVSSNGYGQLGNRGDCGFNMDYFTYNVVPSCPQFEGLVCGGSTRGTCNDATGTCSCVSGYEGGDCSLKSCPTSTSWFGTSISINASGDRLGTATCAGVGDCSSSTGRCSNCGGNFNIFVGDGCEKLSCLQTGINNRSLPSYCNDNGACLTLKHLARLTLNAYGETANYAYSTPWDADMVQGCACFRLESIDNQYETAYDVPEDMTISVDGSVGTPYRYPDINDFSAGKFFRGPFSLTATNFIGVNCGEKSCPVGDNPHTHGREEVQTLKCHGNSGYFTLTFRDNTTVPIPASSTSKHLKYYLQELYTIHEVEVSINGVLDSPFPICSVSDDRIVYIRYMSELGDLPLIVGDVSFLDDTTYELPPTVTVNELVKGTKENQECSGQGTCDTTTGICKCSPSFESSDGTLFNSGSRGDCSFYNPPGSVNLPHD